MGASAVYERGDGDIMGMYTELIFGARIKEDAPVEVVVICKLSHNYPKLPLMILFFYP